MMDRVKRYDAVHIRYEDNNIRYGEGCEVEMVAARDYDALHAEAEAWKSTAWERLKRVQVLHAEAEALRAENGRLRPLAEDRDQQYDMKVKARQQRDEMLEQLEVARGLLREASELISNGDFDTGVCCCGSSVASHGFGDGHSPVDEGGYYAGGVSERIYAFLTSAPAPEVQADQGERQEAACWVPRACLDKLRNGHNNSPAVLTDGPAEFNDTPLYTAPQPGPDVRELVSADDVRDACANAVSVFTEVTNADQCREVAEYMREELLAQIAHRLAQRK